MDNLLTMIFYAWLAVAGLMTLLWLWHFPLKNAALVDVGWSLGLPLIAWVYFAKANPGNLPLLLLAVLFSLWGLRLGLYLFKTRIWGQAEEGRYQELRRQWKSNIGIKFFFFYQFQALLDLWLALPLLIVALNPEPGFSFWESLGLVIWLVGWVGEVLADYQLNSFKKDPNNKGEVCNVGLWRYSRHPNYFFEFCLWLGYAVFALGSPWGWLAFLAPATILTFLFKITGIPATEAQSLRSRGDKYRDYQKLTSRFVPWFPKKN